jgi:hypothetical protein
MPKRSISKVYETFAAEHYVDQPLRNPAQVQAVIQAAGVNVNEVTKAFWDGIRLEWLWGASPAPFAGRDARKANAHYRRLCVRNGTKP